MRRPVRQCGAALLTAMILVTVVATLATGMLWQQWRAVQVEAAERTQAQAAWILQGALDWARMLLREDARTGSVDALSEPWAAPLAEARLSTFLAIDRALAEDVPDAFLSGRIEDAQARYNLRNLVQQGKVVPAELQALVRLCAHLGLAPDIAPRLAEALRRATPGSSADAHDPAPGPDGAPAAPVVAAPDNVALAPLMPAGVEDLGWLGLPAPAVQRLQPYVVLLPRETPVNLNTASREVIAAVLPGADLAGAERIVQARVARALDSPDVVRTLLGPQAMADARRISVNTSYFHVTGVMRLDALVVAQRSLVERNGRDVRVLFTRRLQDRAELEAAIAP